MEQRTEFRAEVRDVYSGDDLIIWVDLGVDSLWKKVRFRLHGVDTPKAVGCGPDTEAGRIRSEVYELVRRHPLRIEVVGRPGTTWTGNVTIERPVGDLNLNQYLIDKGYPFNRNKGLS
jgi:hypothetical protein